MAPVLMRRVPAGGGRWLSVARQLWDSIGCNRASEIAEQKAHCPSSAAAGGEPATLMIAVKGLSDRKWPADFDRRQRHLYDGYAVQEAGLKRRSTISHPRVKPHDLASFGAASF